jgi:hypothetical protein
MDRNESNKQYCFLSSNRYIHAPGLKKNSFRQTCVGTEQNSESKYKKTSQVQFCTIVYGKLCLRELDLERQWGRSIYANRMLVSFDFNFKISLLNSETNQ